MGSSLVKYLPSTSPSKPSLFSSPNPNSPSSSLLRSSPQYQFGRQIPVFRIKRTPFAERQRKKEERNVQIGQKRLSWMELIYHPMLFEMTLDYLNYEDDENLMLCNRRMKSEVYIHQLKRQSNWKLTFHRLQKKIFLNMPNRATEQSEHSLDLDRTCSFFSTEDFEQQVGKLDHIMKALSLYIPYFQGLNSIVATFLSYYDENITFWITKYLISKTENIHNDQRKYYQFMTDVETHLKYHNTQVITHLQKFDLNVEYFAMRWVLGLFSYDLDRPTLMKVWDLICLDGLKSLKWFIVSIFEELKEKILLLEEDDLNRELKMELKLVIREETGDQIIKLTKESLLKEKYGC